VEIPRKGADGVLATQGGRFGGWSLLVLDGKPMFAYACTNQDGEKYRSNGRTRPASPVATRLAPGKHTIVSISFTTAAGSGKGGKGTLTVDGKRGRESIEMTNPPRQVHAR
jgi:arylsulfatase